MARKKDSSMWIIALLLGFLFFSKKAGANGNGDNGGNGGLLKFIFSPECDNAIRIRITDPGDPINARVLILMDFKNVGNTEERGRLILEFPDGEKPSVGKDTQLVLPGTTRTNNFVYHGNSAQAIFGARIIIKIGHIRNERFII